MIKNTTSHHKLTRLSMCVIAALSPHLVQAEAEKSDDEQIERISIVGSNIKRATDIGTLPVTTLTEKDIENTSAVTGDELLRSIPQIGEVAFGGATGNGGVNDARGDVSSINLRGVGTGNTLTLLNGRRLVNHPGTQSENFVPVTTVNSNTLPVSGLRSLEILRDGAAAIYGSDAVAGVINYKLKDDFEGSKVSVSYGSSEGTPLDEKTFNFLTGFDLNGGKTHITASATYYERNGMMASERDYSASHDLRQYPGLPEAFIDGTQLDNRSTATPWGDFQSSSLGRFHLQPDTQSGCVEDLAGGVCADKGSFPRDNRYDRGADRSLVSDVDRLNFYTYLTHDLGNDIELFGEAIYYNAQAKRTREQTPNLTAQRFKISADAAFNPFNEEVTVRSYRAIDTGPRNIQVDDMSYRALAGLRGIKGDWDWETAAFYSEAETNDMANRIQASKFQAAINSSNAATAYNIFTGGDLNNPNTGDTSLNSHSVIDQFMVDVTRDSKTSLASIDFKTSNGELWDLPAGSVGIAMGLEFRHETFEDDRDELLDGSNPFIDQITGITLSGSNVLGSSPTPDSKGDRDVTSAFVELLVPLVDSGSHYVELQLAGRYENFSDVGSAFKPKVAVFWEPANWMSVRASYAGGFRAPGLPQVTAEAVPRSNTLYDPILDKKYAIVDVRSGNTSLTPEDDTNTSIGFVFQPSDQLTITLDAWRIEQKDLVGILPGSSHLLYDSLLRSQGTYNENVIRDPNTNEVIKINNTYKNLDAREIEGVDLSLTYDWDTSFGDWEFTFNAAKLTKFEQVADPISAQLVAAQKAGDPSVPADQVVKNVGDLLKQDGRPELRARASINWRMEQWGAGMSTNYVSEVEDTSTTATVDDEVIKLPVDSYQTVNFYADYRFEGKTVLQDSKLRIGVRNLFDEQPPLADELGYGYFGGLHSNRGRYFHMSFSKTF
ncbi:TonB-dependent receptor domain-containing protein [Pseudoalteromonas denitrificans]|uniref:Outer membrane receptor proteins, mostly Fe transport n=1 Tax=Pseudoalteromonas denitrificans DSM 6059 TaxID=1123010 RepID=A0A1I1NJI3_9GAMM|nr:TonB-dependent receptor [Pseudoalteromonas denitrificans]SFC94893.1 Outer membrane receptor proteins, mostly Fe transport [Pseudoalteromonas denitrificans DSM 6059]